MTYLEPDCISNFRPPTTQDMLVYQNRGHVGALGMKRHIPCEAQISQALALSGSFVRAGVKVLVPATLHTVAVNRN